MTTTLAAFDAEHRGFWRKRCPGMSSGAGPAPAVIGDTDSILADLRRAGYVQIGQMLR